MSHTLVRQLIAQFFDKLFVFETLVFEMLNFWLELWDEVVEFLLELLFLCVNVLTVLLQCGQVLDQDIVVIFELN